MHVDVNFGGPRRVAVIGAGISGLGAAWHLAPSHQVTLFEAEGRLGGHARTRWAGRRGDQAVDTGFIVFNYVNYPHLTALFAELDVPVVKSDMSFGASVAGGKLEYGLRDLSALFAQKRNLADPRFWRMCRDVLRFNARAEAAAAKAPGMTIAGLIEALGLGDWFTRFYLLPLSGAIWSTPKEKILDFPAEAMISFFRNHALMGLSGQHQWYTIAGGSREYVARLESGLRGRGVEIRLSAPVAAVRRGARGPEVRGIGGQWERFDEVIFATHSDDTLRMLADPTAEERAVLGAVRYQPNQVVLHGDASVMPQRRAVWSSWNYTEAPDKRTEAIDLTYWMNSLQPWLREDEVFVTLNSTRAIREDLIWDTCELRHPVYDTAALAAQAQAAAMNGQRSTWFCGAWMKNGFHEDGLASALDVVRGIGSPVAARIAAE
jgi:hypothetical protein